MLVSLTTPAWRSGPLIIARKKMAGGRKGVTTPATIGFAEVQEVSDLNALPVRIEEFSFDVRHAHRGPTDG